MKDLKKKIKTKVSYSRLCNIFRLRNRRLTSAIKIVLVDLRFLIKGSLSSSLSITSLFVINGGITETNGVELGNKTMLVNDDEFSSTIALYNNASDG
jgi:hypothetical protein